MSLIEPSDPRVERSKVLANRSPRTRLVRGACVANAALDAYARRFAGRARWQCAPSLLADLTDVLVAAHDNITSSGLDPESAEAIARAIRACREEATAIAQSQAQGSPGERLNMLAELANVQFRWMQIHLAGQHRAVLRPGLLARLENGLRDTRAAMLAVGGGIPLARSVKDNAATVETVLAEVAAERQAAAAARAQVDRDRLRWLLLEHAEELGTGNTLVGINIPTNSSDVCDAMFEVLVQLQDVLGEHPQEVSAFARTAEAHARLCSADAEARRKAANTGPAADLGGL